MARWHTLLSHWVDVEFRHSLTFPFLVGALREPVGSSIPGEAQSQNELAQLLDEIRNFSSSTHIFHIYRCHNLDKLVLSRVAGAAAPPAAAAVAPDNRSAPSLYASDVASQGGRIEPGVLAGVIWAECGTAILNGKFSCRGKLFQDFTPDEVRIIGRALA